MQPFFNIPGSASAGSQGLTEGREKELEWDLERTVREFVIRNFIFEDDGSLQAETSFLDNGIIDSTGVLELIGFLEETYGVKVEDQEIIPENLDSVRNIISFLKSKLGTALNLPCAEAIFQ